VNRRVAGRDTLCAVGSGGIRRSSSQPPALRYVGFAYMVIPTPMPAARPDVPPAATQEVVDAQVF